MIEKLSSFIWMMIFLISIISLISPPYKYGKLIISIDENKNYISLLNKYLDSHRNFKVPFLGNIHIVLAQPKRKYIFKAQKTA